MHLLRRMLPRLAPLGLVVTAGAILLVSLHGDVQAAEKAEFDGLPAATGATAPAAVTYWLGKGTMSGTKEKAAATVTRLSAAFAERGYRFAGLVPHVENSDFQGLWVTYVPDR